MHPFFQGSSVQQVPSRPTSLAVGIPRANSVTEGPLSAPAMQLSSLPESVAVCSSTHKKGLTLYSTGFITTTHFTCLAAVHANPMEEKTAEEKPLITVQLPSLQQKNAQKEESSWFQSVASVEDFGGETNISPHLSTSCLDENGTSTNQQQESDSRSSSEEPRFLSEEDVKKDVRVVIADLVNYVVSSISLLLVWSGKFPLPNIIVSSETLFSLKKFFLLLLKISCFKVYEETSTIERKRSLLLQTTAFSDRELGILRGIVTEESPQGRNVITPSRFFFFFVGHWFFMVSDRVFRVIIPPIRWYSKT